MFCTALSPQRTAGSSRALQAELHFPSSQSTITSQCQKPHFPPPLALRDTLLCIAGLRGQPRLTSLAVLPTRQHFCPSYSLPHHCPGVSSHDHLTCRKSVLWERERRNLLPNYAILSPGKTKINKKAQQMSEPHLSLKQQPSQQFLKHWLKSP